jgi:hypothetical protein
MRTPSSLAFGLFGAAAVFTAGLLIGLWSDRDGRSTQEATGIATVTVTGRATTAEDAADSFSVQRDQLVELIQICAAIANGRLPGPDNPIATPPAMTQAVLDSTIANCRPRQR